MNPRFLSQPRLAILIAGLTLISGCGRRAGVYANSPTSPAPIITATPEDPNDGTSTVDSNQPKTETERETKREEAVDQKIIETLPEKEMSRKEITELRNKVRDEEIQQEKDSGDKPSDSDKPKTDTPPKKEKTSDWPDNLHKPKPKAEPAPKKEPAPKTEEKPTTPKTDQTVDHTSDNSKKTDTSPTVNPKTPTDQDGKDPWPWPSQSSTTPSSKPSDKPSTKPENKPNTKPETKPTVDADDDSGIDPGDENYTGPKEVIYHPHSTADFQLSEIAAQLAAMKPADYLKLQADAIDSKYPACNYFVITALFEAKVVDENHLPMFTAAGFPKNYFIPKGWKKVDLQTAGQMLKDGKSFDIVIQKGPAKGKTHGHIAIPLGLNANGDPVVAEGVLGKATNRIRVYSLREISKYSIYIRQ